MKISRWFLVLLLPVSLVFLFILAGIMALVLYLAPPAVSAVGIVLMGLLVLWFIIRRRGSSSLVAGSETSLIGRQSSKDGLL